MRRLAIVAAACAAGLLVAAQLALPPLASHRAEDRLTKEGGTAEVKVRAFPAVRLLFKEGDLLRVRARGIELPVAGPGERVLSDLDGFDDVDIRVADARTGPFDLTAVTLERRGGDAPYTTTARGTATPRELGTFFGGFLGGLAGATFVFLKGSVFPNYLTVATSVQPLVMVLLGGVGALAGAPIGAALYTLLDTLVTKYTEYWQLVVGAILIVLVVAFPRGIVGLLAERRRD
jgi:hypothetical protein